MLALVEGTLVDAALFDAAAVGAGRVVLAGETTPSVSVTAAALAAGEAGAGADVAVGCAEGVAVDGRPAR